MYEEDSLVSLDVDNDDDDDDLPDGGDHVGLLLEHEGGQGQLVELVQGGDAVLGHGTLQVQGGLHRDVKVHHLLLDLQPPQLVLPKYFQTSGS